MLLHFHSFVNPHLAITPLLMSLHPPPDAIPVGGDNVTHLHHPLHPAMRPGSLPLSHHITTLSTYTRINYKYSNSIPNTLKHSIYQPTITTYKQHSQPDAAD